MKKTLLLLVIFTLCGIGTKSQAQTGYYTYNEPGRHYSTSALFPTVDGGLLVAMGDVRFPYFSLEANSPAIIIKLSEQMEETGSVQLSDNGVFSYILDLYPDPANSKLFYAIGKIHDLECQCEKPYLVHFDGNLNILSQAVIDLPDECRYLTDASTFLADDGCIYWVSAYQTETESPNYSFSSSRQIYLKINLDGGLENVLLDNDLLGFYYLSGDIFPYLDGTGDFGHLYTTYNDFSGHHNTLIRFTRDLETSLVYEDEGTMLYEPYGNLIYHLALSSNFQSTLTLPDGKLLYTEGSTIELITGDDYIDAQLCSPIFKMDLEQYQILQYQIIGRENDSTEHVETNAIDYIRPDELFHCCYVFPGMDYLLYLPKKIMVTKTDDNLNVTWQKSFLFDGQHYPQGVKAAEDGGCWVYGMIRQNDDIERSGFVFRLNAEGLLHLPEGEESPHPYAFCPNPVKDRLHIMFSTDFQPAQIDFYDLQGRLVSTQRSNFENIDMSQLPAGTYTMRVTLEDGKVYADKLIKE